MVSRALKIHTIQFEDLRLPQFASFLDVAASILPVSEETARWFWHFTICSGKQNEDTAALILLHARELLAALSSPPISLIPDLAQRFPGCDASAIVSEWCMSLQQIMATAQTKEFCLWTGDDL